VHTAVAGGVDLHHVETPGTAVGEIAAGVALATGDVRRPLGAVQAAREDARRGGFATAARAGEQVGMTDPPGPQSTPQRRGDGVLADHFGEGLRAITTVQSGGHPDRLVEAADAPHRCGWRAPVEERAAHPPTALRCTVRTVASAWSERVDL